MNELHNTHWNMVYIDGRNCTLVATKSTRKHLNGLSFPKPLIGDAYIAVMNNDTIRIHGSNGSVQDVIQEYNLHVESRRLRDNQHDIIQNAKNKLSLIFQVVTGPPPQD